MLNIGGLSSPIRTIRPFSACIAASLSARANRAAKATGLVSAKKSTLLSTGEYVSLSPTGFPSASTSILVELTELY